MNQLLENRKVLRSGDVRPGRERGGMDVIVLRSVPGRKAGVRGRVWLWTGVGRLWGKAAENFGMLCDDFFFPSLKKEDLSCTVVDGCSKLLLHPSPK